MPMMIILRIRRTKGSEAEVKEGESMLSENKSTLRPPPIVSIASPSAHTSGNVKKWTSTRFD